MQKHTTALLLAVSLIMNIGLTWRINTFKKSVAELTKKSWESKTHPSKGSLVNDLKVTDIDAKPVTISMKGSGFEYTVLYVFRPKCSWCKKNVANIKSLALQTGSKFRLIGLSTTRDGLAAHIQENGLNFPIYVLPEGMNPETLDIIGTPTTFIISNAKIGKVLSSWTGEYKDFKTEIQQILKIQLPS